MLADEQASPEQFAASRVMNGARRQRLAERLFWSVLEPLQTLQPAFGDSRESQAVRCPDNGQALQDSGHALKPTGQNFKSVFSAFVVRSANL